MNTEKTIATRDEGRLESVKQRPAVAPAVDVLENREEVLLVADLPGVTQDNLRVDLEEERLIIEGKREGWDYRRSFFMPEGIDREKVSAVLKNGVLTLHLPKAAAVKPRRIEVLAG
jgi:HSP20 family molecular chaperone IbpA